MLALVLAVCCLLNGVVHSVSGAPLAGVRITVHSRTVAQSLNSDAHGKFSLTEPAGEYQLDALSRGYHSASVLIALDQDRSVDIALEPLNAPTLRTIATVTVNGRLTPILGAVFLTLGRTLV